MTEVFRSLEYPYVFHQRDLAAEATLGIHRETLIVGELELEKLHKIERVLSHPSLEVLIDEGKITLGIIKPHANEGKNLPSDDQSAAEKISQIIGEDNIVFSFSTQLMDNQVEEFYSDIKTKYSEIDAGNGRTVWDGIFDFAKSGPLTFILIYREEGNAVGWWREKMGKTRPNEANPNSIRGKYGLQEKLPNNLTHGSDSIDSVKKELGVLKSIVTDLSTSITEIRSSFPSESLIRNLGIIDQSEEILSIERIFDSNRRSESWIYGYKMLVKSNTEKIQYIYFKEKNMISFGNIEEKAAQEYKRAKELSSLGIKTTKVYGVKGASVYEEFIVNDSTSEVIESIEKGQVEEISVNRNLNQLIEIAATLDKHGYHTLNFISDLIFDSRNNYFSYIDFGMDLGEKGNEPSLSALRTLIARFPRHSSYIRNKYQQ